MIYQNKCSQMFLTLLLICHQLLIQAGGEGIESYRLLDETCGEIPDEFQGTAQSTAAIFVKRNRNTDSDLRNLEFLHTGTIVHSNVIITVLRTTPDQSRFIDENGKTLSKIYVGTTINTTDSNGQTRAQIREVDAVVPYFNLPARLNYVLVMLHLSEPFDLGSPVTKSICLPLTSTFPSLIKDPPDLTIRHISLKGYAKKYVKSLEVHRDPIQFVQLMVPDDLMECEKHFRAKKHNENFEELYCGHGYTDASSGVCASLGSADVLQHDGRLYLNGLAVLVPGKTCARDDVFFFFNLLTNDTDIQNWMSNSIKCLSLNKFSCPSGECIRLENICNKKSDCVDGSGFDEHPSLCEGNPPAKGADRIRAPVQSNAPQIKTPPLLQGTKEITQVGKICPVPIYSPGVATRCTKDDFEIDCGRAHMGTKLELYCKSHYQSLSRHTRHVMTCTADGTWDSFKTFSCKAHCGRINSNSKSQPKPFLAGAAEVTKQYAFPWFAALFIWSEETTKFDFACGGSLIETSVVVTAAHCVSNPKNQQSKTNGFRIVLAPTSSVFEDNTESSGSKILKVTSLWIPRTFDMSTLTSDIALIQLNETVEYTDNIQPVCYLTETEARTPSAGSVGLIAGFGKDETNKITERLKFAHFSVFLKEDCEESLGVYNWAAEFCAGTQNGTAACQGDSGGGLVFKQYSSESQSPYVLKGIVSRGLTYQTGECVSSGATVFTHFDAFGAWILDTLMNNEII